MKNELYEFLCTHQYPLQAQEELIHQAAVLANSTQWNHLLYHCKNAYKEGLLDGSKALSQVRTFAQSYHLPQETILLLFLIELSFELYKQYEKEKISNEIFQNTIKDLLYKAKECKQVKGIWGTFVADWQWDFFEMKRFALGRLQFEEKALSESIIIQNNVFEKGDIALNMHIPSSGKLLIEDCADSFKKAKDFFQKKTPVLFLCQSWLLDPRHQELLPSTSSICQFGKLFQILQMQEKEIFQDAWRIFHQDEKEPYEDLPQKTRLQKAYVTRLQNKEKFYLPLGGFVL